MGEIGERKGKESIGEFCLGHEEGEKQYYTCKETLFVRVCIVLLLIEEYNTKYSE